MKHPHHMIALPTPRPAPDRTPCQIVGPARVGVLSDIHAPFHALEPLELALAYLDRFDPTHILLNGDTLDAEAVASWDKDPAKKDFWGEIEAAHQILDHIRHRFPRAMVYLKQGNHEARLQLYLWRKAPELAGLFSLTIAGILELEKRGITEIPSLTRIRLGKLLVIHGHEYRFSISNPVNPARGIYLRAAVSAMCAHFHQISQHSHRNGHGQLVTTWSTGCLCQLEPDYAPLNNWGHGFATVEVSEDGSFNVSNLRIIHGKVYNS